MAILRMDMGFYTGIILWPRLQSLCRVHVLWAYSTRTMDSSHGATGVARGTPGLPRVLTLAGLDGCAKRVKGGMSSSLVTLGLQIALSMNWGVFFGCPYTKSPYDYELRGPFFGCPCKKSPTEGPVSFGTFQPSKPCER